MSADQSDPPIAVTSWAEASFEELDTQLTAEASETQTTASPSGEDSVVRSSSSASSVAAQSDMLSIGSQAVPISGHGKPKASVDSRRQEKKRTNGTQLPQSTNEQQKQYLPVQQMQPGQQLPSLVLVPACSGAGPSDEMIIKSLAPERVHHRLLRAASRAQLLLCGRSGGSLSDSSPVLRVELYGSLALSNTLPSAARGGGAQPSLTGASTAFGYEDTDPHPHYVRAGSDVDLVVLLREGCDAEATARRLMERGSLELVDRKAVPKFRTHQFTLCGPSRSAVASSKDSLRGVSTHGLHGFAEVSIDLTCVDSEIHFEQLRSRQAAFRQIFFQTRSMLEADFGPWGIQAFDSFTYLLKAFASKVPNSALSGYQAVCLGLFTLQLRLFDLSGQSPPTGTILMECFLRFCTVFFADTSNSDTERLRSYRFNAIDLSCGGRLLPRMNGSWNCEMYILACEVQFESSIPAWMNIAHSIEPHAICSVASKFLGKTIHIAHGKCKWV